MTSIKVFAVDSGLRIKITETRETDLATKIAASLGYHVTDGVLNSSKDFIDDEGSYQGYCDPNLGIGNIWIDDNSEAYSKFNNLGGESWIENQMEKSIDYTSKKCRMFNS